MRLTDGVHLVGSGEIGLSDPWDAHVYALDGGDEIALIDAGCGERQSIDQILAQLRSDGLAPERVSRLLLTHWHADHAGGAAAMRARLGVRVSAATLERERIEGGGDGVAPCTVDEPLEHGAQLFVGSLRVRALVVPGHSSGSTCFLAELPAGRALFSGDVVFMNGILGLLNHPDSHLEQYRSSFDRLLTYRIEMLFPGHMLFFLRDGQRHIDAAADALRGGFVPYSVGQLGIDFQPPRKM